MMTSFDFFNLPILFQPHYSPGVKAQPVHEADNLTAICEPIV
jgi:hypothetical protein